MHVKFRVYLLILILLTGVSFSQSAYYVSPDGNDSNDGQKTETAFKILQHAADVVNAGDSVYVLEGEYSGFDIRTSGTELFPIVFKSANQNVVINFSNPVTDDGINIESADWVVIDGFTIINQPRAGIRIVTSDNVTIRNNYCTENYRWGIFTGFTDNILIENNTCSFSEDEHGIYVSNSSDEPVIRYNHSFGNNGCGIHMNGDISMGGDGIISNAVVEGNILHDNGYGGGSAINMDGVQGSKIFNNLAYNNHATGIAMYRIDGAEASKNNKVFNNTIIQPPDGRWNILITDGSTGNILYNNILINHHSFRGSISIDEASGQDFISDYNIVENRLSNDDGSSNMGLNEWQGFGYDLHSQIALPEEEIFVNPASGDFNILEISPATNTGTNLVSDVVLKDINNLSRPQGEGYDIGAFEFQDPSDAEGSGEMYRGFVLYQNYPNPFNPVTNLVFRTADFGFVSLKVYDILGREVAAPVNEERDAGIYNMTFDASGLTSGVYFYRLESGGFSSTMKMILLR